VKTRPTAYLLCFLWLSSVAACARAQEFSWTDSAGKEQKTRDRKAVPSDAWKAVKSSVTGKDAPSGERFTTEEGATIALEGVQAPDVVDDGTALSRGGEAARKRLEELVKDRRLVLEWEGDRVLYDGALLCHAYDASGKLLAEILLEEGLVRLSLEDAAPRYWTTLRAAAERAVAQKLGVHAAPAGEIPPPAPYYLGVGLGLYAQDPDHDYSGFLKEIKEFGATHVLLSSSWLMEDWKSNEIGPVRGRSPSWACLSRTTRQARELGLGVAYLPLVLLRTGTVEHWRGDIQPTKTWLWFRNYGRYVARFADLAREHGVSLVSAGSEYSSMEQYTGAWKAVIGNLRARCGAKLTYSANWDHLRVIKFWNDLDVAGMTAYHSLTGKDDPTVAELEEGWRPIRDKLLELQRELEIPIFFTEVGYPSQDGANKDPWNYFINPDKPDLEEQADCFRAFTRTWESAPPEFRGFFIWKWWRNGDDSDRASYSIYGKPAYEVMKTWFAKKKATLPR
jgi:endonuclease YncB( thermonuclease family)